MFTPFEELRNVDVLIKGEKIKEVRPSRTKNDDDVIEAEYVIPGLIDPHTHNGLYRLEVRQVIMALKSVILSHHI